MVRRATIGIIKIVWDGSGWETSLMMGVQSLSVMVTRMGALFFECCEVSLWVSSDGFFTPFFWFRLKHMEIGKGSVVSSVHRGIY
jgi:hypothetical protein